ncbi:hypothetical protein ACLB2K_038132 [Fragaria x ananassa]
MSSIEQWRDFFAAAPNKSTVFDVLDQAITVAASDFPEEFSRWKTQILESIQADLRGKSETESGPVEAPPRNIVRIKLPSWYKAPAKPSSVVVDQAVKPIIKPKPLLDEEAKLEATKRKIHDRYEQIENNKRQKRIQVLDYVPKQEFKTSTAQKQRKKAGNHCRKRVPKNLGFQSLPNRLVSC